ncbi:MAG: hypothetical protein ACI8S6_000958 [Myxococcota bacterium]
MIDIEEALHQIRARPPRWVDAAALPVLRLRDGVVLSERARAGFIADLKSEGPDSRAEVARTALPLIEPADRVALMGALLVDWAVAGQPPRDRRWLIFATGLLGDAALHDALGRRVGEELAGRRYKAAGYCIEALARGGGPTAKRWLACWSRSAPSLSLRAAAWSARQPLGPVATVAPPDHGFSPRGERSYDHAGRPLQLRLTVDGEIQIFDGARPLKSLPAARKQDDPDAVRRSRDTYKALRQAVRDSLRDLDQALEEAMIIGQPLADWPELCAGPLGWRTSRGLIFEARTGGDAPPVRFFLSDEGDPLDHQGAELSLDPAASVRVVHPVHVEEPERAAWRSILSEARAVQPLDQLGRSTRRPSPGPGPLAGVLAVVPPVSTPRLIRELGAQGYLPDTFGAHGFIERSLRFLGPYLVVILHEGYAASPFSRRPTQPLRLRAVEIRRGKLRIPSESLPVAVFSEIAVGLLGL